VAQFAMPVLYALFVWWFSTGVLLYLNGLPRHTHRWTMLGVTVVAVAGLAGLAYSCQDGETGGAYHAFTAAVAVWAWHETSFLLGYVTGPRTAALPEGSSGWQRFHLAVQAIAYHEIAIALTAVFIVWLTWGGVNQTGTLTFLVLWIMRLSAKFNVFLGVRNLNEQFLPEHLRYLGSYFRRRPMNMLFPVSIIGSTAVLTLCVIEILAVGTSAFDQTSGMFVALMLALAILEHWLMVMKFDSSWLWRWYMPSEVSLAETLRAQPSTTAIDALPAPASAATR
jgi:putative photosynthetic complex assembly protein 2